MNFTNNDAYGTSGGNLRIRGFDGSRVSVTFDGMPLNDSGNYALFTNQMLDPELVDRVDVNLGTTDVDSPTASATGGTVAYRTQASRPTISAAEAVVSGGNDNYKRGFLRVDTGEWGDSGTNAFFAASYQKYDKFKGPGDLEKKQFNAVFRQDFENENFIQLGLHYNENRNAFYRTASDASFTSYGRELRLPRHLHARCAHIAGGAVDNENAQPGTDATPTLLNSRQPGESRRAAPTTRACASTRRTPATSACSRSGISATSVRLTFDPSWQYTLANGGGTSLTESYGTTADRYPPASAMPTFPAST